MSFYISHSEIDGIIQAIGATIAVADLNFKNWHVG